jgi:hypothetical protein
LHAIWTDQCRAQAHARHTQAVREHAAPADAAEILKDTDVLWRTVRATEYAGLDGAQVIREAIEGRSFTGARSHPAVLDARIRKNTGHVPPPRASWATSLPKFEDPAMDRYMTEIAAAMDDRQCRIGAHAALERPLWAVQALGQIPDDPADRAEWQRKAGQLAAYREITGWDHPGEAIGPEPPRANPEAWAAPGQKAGPRSRDILGTRARRRRTAGSLQAGAIQQGQGHPAHLRSGRGRPAWAS